MIKKLTNQHYKYVIRDLASWYGFKPTITQLKKFLRNEPEMCNSIKTQPYLRYGLDTSEREELLDIFAHKLTGNEWPTNSMSERKSQKWFKKFISKAKKAGIEVDEESLI